MFNEIDTPSGFGDKFSMDTGDALLYSVYAMASLVVLGIASISFHSPTAFDFGQTYQVWGPFAMSLAGLLGVASVSIAYLTNQRGRQTTFSERHSDSPLEIAVAFGGVGMFFAIALFPSVASLVTGHVGVQWGTFGAGTLAYYYLGFK